MIKTEDIEIKFYDNIVLDTEEYLLKKEFRLSNLREKDVLSHKHGDIFTLWLFPEGRFVLDANREDPSIKQADNEDDIENEDHEMELAEKTFIKDYGDLYASTDIFRKDRFIVSTDNIDECNRIYRLVDADNNALSEEYIYMKKCDQYCTVGRQIGDKVLYGLINADGKEVMPCKYDIPTTKLIRKGCDRICFFHQHKTGVMDLSGRIIMMPRPGFIEIFRDYIVVRDEGSEEIYTKNGTLLLSSYDSYLASDCDKMMAYKDSYVDVYSIEYKKADVKFKGHYDELVK